MGCGSCGSGGCSSGGCGKKGGCATGGCNKLNTYDWFNGLQSPNRNEYENVYEIRFKNTRKAFYRNVNGLSLITGDLVVVESDRGYDVGQISLGGILADLQMRKRKVNPKSDRVKKIYRRASKEDLRKLETAREREQETLVRTREIVRELQLDMKISDIEFQGDNTKAIFYYIADQRVDFRMLIKHLANEFRVRVEMKQIGLRHESGLVGGIGSCGRELCCSTWLTDFKSVSTSAARYQNLSLNPMKISGQCGRLKCCLNFELDSYLDALEYIPKIDKLETDSGTAFLQKTDIFKRIMWFSYANETTWISISVDTAISIREMNRNGEKPAVLSSMESTTEAEESIDFVDVVGQATLREEPRRRKKKKGKGGNNRRGGPQARSKNKTRSPRNTKDKRGGGDSSGQSRNNRGGNPRNKTANSRGNNKPEDRAGNAGQKSSHGANTNRKNPERRGKGSQGATPPTDKG